MTSKIHKITPKTHFFLLLIKIDSKIYILYKYIKNSYDIIISSDSKETMNRLTITIKPQSKVLDGITLYERIDKSTLMKLCSSTLLKKTFNNKQAGKVFQNEKQQLERYASLIDDKGRIPITYLHSAGAFLFQKI